MLAFLQKIGKSLMLPVATLPAAGILKGFGLINYEQDFHLGRVGAFLNQYLAPFLNAGADAILNNLAILFAVGVAIGLAKDAVAALSAVVGHFVLTNVLLKIPESFTFITLNKPLNMGVVGGIMIGLVSAYCYNRFHKIKLPDWLGFFSGKRFVPMVTAFSILLLGIVFGLIWAPIQEGLNSFGEWLIGIGGVGSFLFGVANRLLVPFGLHHVLNNYPWFILGEYTNANGEVVNGEIARFLAGDRTSGMFMAGFFPIMMFALPGAGLAIVHAAKPHKRKIVGSIIFGSALAAFLTGITEPLEFSFMFLAPVLYVVHAVLTGVAGWVMYALNVKLGFAFSAGLIDYLLYWKLETNQLLLIPVGLAFFVVYYFLFRFLIRVLKLKTPGREDDDEDILEEASVADQPVGEGHSRAAQILAELGGGSNIQSVDACITRLRLIVKDESRVNDSGLKKLGASGVMRLGKGAVQVVFGPQSEAIKDEINLLL
ncbi:N-acetylglucosamine-specific PTS transporter subunit IIBC [Paenibacillus phocaensis]|uniref:N-acetylglucosamine-specific PTS transporter subunit IIBC n=1 Tax=Paenibacillus phocaensis TaxID=1776378 RepID=UPI000839D2B9|nr:N-acetylglucosamine-specific PTS transporter subunit IIBC [Paenibacillus phocaensis]